MNGSWTRMAVLMLGLMEIGSWTQVAEAAETRHGLPSVTSVKSSGGLTSVYELFVQTFTDTETMGAVSLHAYGRTSDGSDVERYHALPKSYRVEREPYAEFLSPDGWYDRYHRILYNFRGRDLIAGVASYYGVPEWPLEEWSWERSELTNVPWGYDQEKKGFWIHPSPTDMPPVPIVVRNEADWKGRLVAIPVELEYFDRRRAREIIEYWGGRLATPEERPEIVLLPDDIDFAWARNHEAEVWVRRGAKLLWERNFPYPGVGDQDGRRLKRGAGGNGVSRPPYRSASGAPCRRTASSSPASPGPTEVLER